MSSHPTSARAGALAKLAEEAARFGTQSTDESRPSGRGSTTHLGPTPPQRMAVVATGGVEHDGLAGYVPVAVAPERGNTRPALPVDGRLHMRMAKPTLRALDAIVERWRAADPSGLRDLERATLVRIAIAMLIADVTQNARGGAAAEAVRAALEPTTRHTTTPMPDLSRWLRTSPLEERADVAEPAHAARPAGGAFD